MPENEADDRGDVLGRYGNDHLDGRDGIDVLQGGPGAADACVNGETVTGCE